MAFEELPENKVKIINNLITTQSPNSVNGSPWLSVFPCNPADLVENRFLLNKAVAAGVVCSGAITLSPASLYSYDIVRRDGEIFDTDVHLLTASGSTILREKMIKKNSPGHHSLNIHPYYLISS